MPIRKNRPVIQAARTQPAASAQWRGGGASCAWCCAALERRHPATALPDLLLHLLRRQLGLVELRPDRPLRLRLRQGVAAAAVRHEERLRVVVAVAARATALLCLLPRP